MQNRRINIKNMDYTTIPMPLMRGNGKELEPPDVILTKLNTKQATSKRWGSEKRGLLNHI